MRQLDTGTYFSRSECTSSNLVFSCHHMPQTVTPRILISHFVRLSVSPFHAATALRLLISVMSFTLTYGHLSCHVHSFPHHGQVAALLLLVAQVLRLLMRRITVISHLFDPLLQCRPCIVNPSAQTHCFSHHHHHHPCGCYCCHPYCV
jgi:hypothetical protein